MRCIINAAKKFAPDAVKEVVGDALFYAHKVTHGFTIGDEPFLDPLGKAILTHALTGSRSYLEFGSGGSTVLAAKTTPIIVSVESDKSFLQAVQDKLQQLQLRPQLAEFIHANIGITTRWGNPLVKWPTPERVEHWERSPPRRGPSCNESRLFRTRCSSMGASASPARWKASRICHPRAKAVFWWMTIPAVLNMRQITEFGQLVGIHGRMAVFGQRPDFDAARCREAAIAFRKDFR